MLKANLVSFIYLIIIFYSCGDKNEGSRLASQNSILINDTVQTTQLDEILFVGMINSKSGIYKYRLSTNTVSEFWSNSKEEIVELSYSPDKKYLFMITAHQSGKKGIFPYIENVKLYNVNQGSNSTKFIENIGNGLQVFSTWTNDSTFRVYLHRRIVTTEEHVEQKIVTYGATGKKLTDEKRNYNLEKEGYPQFPAAAKKLISPNKMYSVLSIDSIQTQIMIINHSKNDEMIIVTKQYQKLNAIGWSNNEKYLVFNTIDISPNNESLYDLEPNTSKLFIYSLPDKKILKVFDGGGMKYFLLNGDYLIFDNGFKEKSQILIYNFHSDTVTDSISVSGGCGLKNIPTIPDYEA